MSRGSNLKRKQKRRKSDAPKINSTSKAVYEPVIAKAPADISKQSFTTAEYEAIAKTPVETSNQPLRLITGGAGGGKAFAIHKEVTLAKRRLVEFMREDKVAYEEMLLEFLEDGDTPEELEIMAKGRQDEEEAPVWGWGNPRMDHQALLETISKRDLASLIHTQIEPIEHDESFMTLAALTIPTNDGSSYVAMQVYSGLMTEAEVVARLFCDDPHWWSSPDNIVVSQLKHIQTF